MKTSEVFPSKFLKASDLRGKSHVLKISSVVQEEIGKDVRLVTYFDGKEKGLVTNKTNATMIAGAFGDETDDWEGHEIEIYPDRVQFQGQLVDAIRVRIPVPRAADDETIPF